MVLPVGIAVSRSDGFAVGKILGEGAQASVHVVLDKEKKETNFVVKAAPLPAKLAAPKRKKSMTEINADSLNMEFLIYSGHLNELQGTHIPKLPPYKSIPAKWEANGYRFLTMERMEKPLMEAFQDYVAACLKQKERYIKISPFATRLIEIIMAFHNKCCIVVDVKADNFMVAKAAKKTESLPSRIRCVDLAMVRRYIDSSTGKVAGNEGSDFLGTPLYASMNMHDGNSPSRHDDMFSVGLVIAEMVIRTQAVVDGTTRTFENGKFPSYLPWANESSLQATGKVKREQVEDIDSSFYKSMASADIARSLHTFLQKANTMSFKAKPDYNEFLDLVSDLTVPVTVIASPTPAKKAKRAAGRSKDKEDDKLTESISSNPEKKHRPVPFVAPAGRVGAKSAYKNPPATALAKQQPRPVAFVASKNETSKSPSAPPKLPRPVAFVGSKGRKSQSPTAPPKQPRPVAFVASKDKTSKSPAPPAGTRENSRPKRMTRSKTRYADELDFESPPKLAKTADEDDVVEMDYEWIEDEDGYLSGPFGSAV